MLFCCEFILNFVTKTPKFQFFAKFWRKKTRIKLCGKQKYKIYSILGIFPILTRIFLNNLFYFLSLSTPSDFDSMRKSESFYFCLFACALFTYVYYITACVDLRICINLFKFMALDFVSWIILQIMIMKSAFLPWIVWQH